MRLALVLLALLSTGIASGAEAAGATPSLFSDIPTGYIYLGLIAFALMYFLPSIIASSRGHRSAGGIFVLNLFLGWTFLGWVLALAWACSYAGAPAKRRSTRKAYGGRHR